MGLLDFFKKKIPKEAENDTFISPTITINMVNVFWKKFQNQLPNLLQLETTEVIERSNKLLNELFPHVKIEFEIDEDNDSFSKIVLTAEGQVKEFQTVMQLVQHAPKIQGSEVVAFRQRIIMNLATFEIGMQGFKLACSNVLIHATPYKGRINIAIVFNKTIEQDKLQHAKQMTFIMLDHVLGEYDFAVKVGTIDFIEGVLDDSFIPLTDFIPVFDKMWSDELGHTNLFPTEEVQLQVFEINDQETKQVIAVGQLNQLAKAVACRADFGVRLDVIIEVPDKSVFETIYDCEDELTHTLQTQQTGIFALALLLFSEDTRISTWYVADEEQAVKFAQQLAKKYSSLALSIETHYDPLWDSYLTWCQ